jgi:hypothetical protein
LFDRFFTENEEVMNRKTILQLAAGTFRLPAVSIVALVFSAGVVLIPATARGQIFVTSPGATGDGTIGEYSTSGAPLHPSLVSGLDDPLGIALSGSDLFVAFHFDGTVGEYTTAGATVHSSLISGLGSDTQNVAVSGSDLFVASGNKIGEYTTSGAPLSPSLITGLSTPVGMAFSGSDLFVSNYASNTIGEYTTSGTPVSPSLISVGLDGPEDIVVSGSDLFVANYKNGTIGEYTTSGTTLNPALVSGLGPDNPFGLALSGSDLFVTNIFNGTVGEFTTSGAPVHPTLISGITTPFGIAVVPVPEPAAGALLLIAAAGILMRRQPRGKILCH